MMMSRLQAFRSGALLALLAMAPAACHRVTYSTDADLEIGVDWPSRELALPDQRADQGDLPAPADLGADHRGPLVLETVLEGLSLPIALAADASGAVLVVEYGKHRVQRVVDGVPSPVAGSGSAGYEDGPALTARFNQPTGIAVAADGKIYVADGYNHRIRLIDNGQVSTLAGSGAAGFLDAPIGLNAMLNMPSGLALGPGNKLYVADRSNNRIRAILLPDGKVSTLAGSGGTGHRDGPASTAEIAAPADVAVDAAGNVFVVSGGRVRVVASGIVSTVAGSDKKGFTDGPVTSASFDRLGGISLDPAGRIYLADANSGLTYPGAVRLIEQGQVGTLTALLYPLGIQWQPGALYVTSYLAGKLMALRW